jgi:hypothetical protein
MMEKLKQFNQRIKDAKAAGIKIANEPATRDMQTSAMLICMAKARLKNHLLSCRPTCNIGAPIPKELKPDGSWTYPGVSGQFGPFISLDLDGATDMEEKVEIRIRKLTGEVNFGPQIRPGLREHVRAMLANARTHRACDTIIDAGIIDWAQLDIAAKKKMARAYTWLLMGKRPDKKQLEFEQSIIRGNCSLGEI